MFTTDAEHEVLVTVADHLGRLASKDLAARCKLGKGPERKGRAERKRLLTLQCSSRWAGTITRRSADMWERQKLNYIEGGVAIIAVDPAYTSQWGREHWYMFLNYSRRTPCSSHHAAVVIGRRALTLTAKQKSNTRDDHTGIRQRTKQQHNRVVARRSRVSQRSQPAQGTTRRKRGNTSSAPPRTVRGAQTNWEQQPPNTVVETLTRKPVTLQRQDTATVQGARPAVSESQPLPTN